MTGLFTKWLGTFFEVPEEDGDVSPTFISLANLTLVNLKCAVGPSGKCEITKPSTEGLMEYCIKFQNVITVS